MRGGRLIGLLVLLVIVILVNLPLPASKRLKENARDTLAPFQNALTYFGDRTKRAGTFIVNSGKAAEEREKLMTEVVTLREQARRLSFLERDNDALRKLLGFKDSYKYSLVACEVVARGDATGWWQTLTLNKGTSDGVAPDMAVISIDGLVGRTMEVSRQSTTVLLVTDPTCRISCKFTRTGALGISSGGGLTPGGDSKMAMFHSPRPNRMDYIAKDQKIFESDSIVTSGLGGVYPEGLLVGYVSRTDMDPSGLYQTADLRPAADMQALKYVFVVLR